MNIKKLIHSAIVLGVLVSSSSSIIFAEEEELDMNVKVALYVAQKVRYSSDPEERKMAEDLIATHEKLQHQKKALAEAKRHQKIVEQRARETENHEIVMRDQGGFVTYLMKKKGLNSVDAIRLMEEGDYFEVKKYANMFAEAKRKEWARAKSKNSKNR